MGAGVALFDYDGDGDSDLLFVDSSLLPGYEGEPPVTRLLRNDGPGADGRLAFVDVTARSGIVVTAYGHGVTAGDVDSDGDLDLYVTSFGANQLFRNDGDGTFTDTTAAAGTGDPLYGTSAAFADPDHDGDLDLYVTNYVDFTYDNNPVCASTGLRSYCHPDVYAGVPDRYYRNRGDGRDGEPTFEEVTEALFGDTRGKGLGVVWADFDGDGWEDLYVANDMTFNFQFQNRYGQNRQGAFEEVALLSGTAVGDRGQEEASMGIAVGDPNGDGLPDIFVTHLDNQTNAFYSNAGEELFVDRRFDVGLAETSLFKVGFGTVFADFDADGDEDLMVANGHIIHNVEEIGAGASSRAYKQPNQLFENLGKGSFREVVGSGLDVVRASRGLAVADLDLDGDLDAVVTNSNDFAEVYRNDSRQGSYLRIALTAADGNRHGVGARLVLRAGDTRQVKEVRTSSSYLSQSELVVHFGLGPASSAEELVVVWPGRGRPGRGRPSRGTLKLRNLPSNRQLRIPRP